MMVMHAVRPDYGASLLRRITRLEKEHSLSLEQKILLAETGTVEQALSVITCAPVRVKVHGQCGNGVIIRRVTLVSGDTGRPLIHARSKIYCANLPAGLVRQIRQKKSGIGTIILQSKLETFRQITKMGVSRGRPYRAYRILHGGMVAFEIREDILI